MISPRNVCFHTAATRSFRFMIFITCESRDKTCPKLGRLVSISSPGGKTVKLIKKSRSSCLEVFCKKEVLKNFAKFTGKNLYWSLYKKELQVSRLYHNILEQFPQISKANFTISFSLENIKTEDGSFLKTRSRHWRCSIKKVFLKIAQSLQKSTCVGVSFSINLIKNFQRQGRQVFAYHDYIFSFLDTVNCLYIK